MTQAEKAMAQSLRKASRDLMAAARSLSELGDSAKAASYVSLARQAAHASSFAYEERSR